METDSIKIAKINGNNPFFPHGDINFGITKREFMAAMILPSLVSVLPKEYLMENTASIAVGFADVLLEELQEP